jgi:chromate transporter
VLTVAVVGYAAKGLGGGLLAAAIAFSPSFAFILIGGRHFDALRSNERARAFLDGAGPAAIGAILGTAVVLAFALGAWWQVVLLAVAVGLLFVLGRSVVFTLLALGVAGSVLVGLHAV